MAVFTGNGAVGSPSFTFSSDTNTGIYRVDADKIGVVTNGTLALQVDSSQRVGIGALAGFSSQLEMNSGAAANNHLTIFSGDGSNGSRFKAQIGFGINGANNDFCINALDSLNGTNVGPHLIFSTQGSLTGDTFEERGRFSRDGYFRLSTSSGGIQFNGDTAAANALDDYEEGSWSHTLSGLTNTNADFTFFRYTKIGNVVNLVGYFLGQGGTASTGAVQLTGIPFAPAYNVVGLCRGISPWSTQAGWTDHVLLSGTTITFKDSNGTNSSITSGAISFNFSFTYRT